MNLRCFVSGFALSAVLACAVSAAADAKSIRVTVGTWPPAMGNPYGQQIQGAVHPFPGIFDALTFMDRQGKTQPRLALSWTNDGANTWTFELRQGVNFMNGEPFNAAAVVAMIDWLKSPDAQRYFYAAEVKNIVRAEATGEYQVTFTTAAPDVILDKRMSLLPPTPPRYWQERGVEGFSQAPIGTGPFVLDSWGQDRGAYTMTAKPGSWRPSQHLDSVEFRILADGARRTQALATGEVDMSYGLSFDDLDGLKADGFSVTLNTIPTTSAWAFSNRNPKSPLADVRVRQAINYAVDRDPIAQVILHGAVTPTSHGIEPGVFGYDPTIAPYPYDPDKARALLKDAGYANGIKLRANVLTVGSSDLAPVFQQAAQDLAKVGIDVELNGVLGTDWVQMWFTADWRGADILSSNWNGATYMDAGRAVESYTCARPNAFFCAPEVEKIFAESNLEFDPDKREKLLQAALKKLQALAPTLYLFPQVEVIAMTPNIKPLPFRGRFVDWTQVEFADE
ncbi:MAG: hypothetical protein KDE14_12870 [Rhodobacteraceae bacterium]|nr:hypothetical protein [Paracoccaceae bacterium]